jgi:hypothetical protein
VSWAAFAADPEWKKVASESQVNGRILTKAESVFLEAADYSPMNEAALGKDAPWAALLTCCAMG